MLPSSRLQNAPAVGRDFYNIGYSKMTFLLVVTLVAIRGELYEDNNCSCSFIYKQKNMICVYKQSYSSVKANAGNFVLPLY